MKAMSLLAVATAVLALPLAAQQPGGMGGMGHRQGGMMQGMDSMMAPMMRVMAFVPEHLLAQKGALGLTGEQEARLTALRDGAKPAHDAAAGQASMHLREMEEAMQTAAPDTGTVKAHFQAALRAMGEAHWAMLSAAAQARAVLTDAQRSKVEEMARHPGPMEGMRQH